MAEEIERVQVIAERNNGSPPERFIQKESNRPILDPPLGKIPIIDLSYVESKDLGQRQLEDSRLKSAASSWGIFQVIGHGIPTSLMDEVRNVQRLFFKQPLEEKQRYASAPQTQGFKEGYGSDAVLSDEQIPNWNDRLVLNVYPEEGRNMDLWPQKPESFKEKILEFNEKVMILVDEIFKSLARSLGLDEVYFINNGMKGRIMWRFNYYPSCSKPDLVFGLKPHSDPTSFTIILPDDQVSGLQVLNDEFGWVKVPIIPDALLVLLGVEIQVMTNGQYKNVLHKVVTNSENDRISLTNGQYKNVLHKVVTNSENDRISLTLFVSSKLENELGPIDELIEEGKPLLFKKTTMKDYVDETFLNYARGKPSIDFLRV